MSCLLLPGCIGTPANPATTQPVTKVDPQLGEGPYWYNRPPSVVVTAPTFDPLWRAAGEAARDAGFRLDRRDYRDGVLTTRPLISQQAFEPWKRDVVAAHDLALSTLDTVRRTVRFEFHRKDDGTYEVAPKVLVERYALTEHRISNVALYREVFALTREEAYRQRTFQENPTLDMSATPPPDFWYALGRDPDLERRLADWIRDRLKDEGVRQAKILESPATKAS